MGRVGIEPNDLRYFTPALYLAELPPLVGDRMFDHSPTLCRSRKSRGIWRGSPGPRMLRLPWGDHFDVLASSHGLGTIAHDPLGCQAREPRIELG